MTASINHQNRENMRKKKKLIIVNDLIQIKKIHIKVLFNMEEWEKELRAGKVQ